MAETDILTIEEGMDALRVTSGELMPEIEAKITGLTGQIEELTGPIVARAVTEYHDGGHYIQLRTTPVLSVTTVTEYDRAGTATVLTAETNTVKPADGYLLDSRGHLVKLTRRSSGSPSCFTAGELNVKVVTSAGRAASTAAVPGAWKTLARSCLRVKWQQEAPAWARTPDFTQATDDEPLPPTAIESMVRAAMRPQLRPGVLVGFA